MKLTVIAHPNSKNPKVEADLFGTLHVYVKEPPLEYKANHAIIMALADYYKKKRSQVHLISGNKSKIKLFHIEENL